MGAFDFTVNQVAVDARVGLALSTLAKQVDESGGVAVYLIHTKPARRIRQATRICAKLPELDRQEAESLGKISVAGSGFARYEVFPGSVTRCSSKNQAASK